MGRNRTVYYRNFFALAACLLSFHLPGASLADALIPVEKFAEIPSARTARLSPDGTKLALVSSIKGQEVIVIHSLSGDNHVINLDKYQANWVAWKSNTRLVASVFTSTDDLIFDYANREFRVSRLVSFDSDGTHLVNIGEPRGGFIVDGGKDEIHPQFEDAVVDMLENDPHHLLQSAIDEIPYKDSALAPSIFRVDIDTGEHHRVSHPRFRILNYQADSNGVVRLGSGLKGTERDFYVRDDEESDWRMIHSSDINHDASFEPLAFVSGQPNLLYVIAPVTQISTNTTGSTQPDQYGLWTFDTKTGGFVTLIDSAVGRNAYHEVRGGQLVSYMTTAGELKYLDPAWQADLQTVRRALKGKRTIIVDRLENGARVLIKIEEPHTPVEWWLLDRTTKPTQLANVIQTYPDVVERGIAPVKRLFYRARDGLQIPAMITLPAGYHAGPIPFVVLPHGGPWACDSDEFDYEAQFLASRGWGVLQPEFRGSTCFGVEFEQRGYHEWGFAMQDDITDGTQWLIDHKVADPTRICIVGGSYGGYAALEGVVKEPDLYRCAAAWAPVTDLPGYIRDVKRYMHPEATLERVGDNSARLDAASPDRHADRIKVPVLLMHGRTDFTVQVRHSEDMEEALKDAKKPVEAIYLDNADHYRLQYQARLSWLRALDRFLGANLGKPGQTVAGQ